MYIQKAIMAQALWLHYIDGLSLRTNSKKLNISHAQFKYHVDMGKQWLAGRIRQAST
jgi:DNA-binding transcriptional regulator LsrR (DeoR family)